MTKLETVAMVFTALFSNQPALPPRKIGLTRRAICANLGD
jgi:hypothetical protein